MTITCNLNTIDSMKFRHSVAGATLLNVPKYGSLRAVYINLGIISEKRSGHWERGKRGQEPLYA